MTEENENKTESHEETHDETAEQTAARVEAERVEHERLAQEELDKAHGSSVAQEEGLGHGDKEAERQEAITQEAGDKAVMEEPGFVANAPLSTGQAQVRPAKETLTHEGKPTDPPSVSTAAEANPADEATVNYLPASNNSDGLTLARRQVEINRAKSPNEKHGLNPAGNPTTESGQNTVT